MSKVKPAGAVTVISSRTSGATSENTTAMLSMLGVVTLNGVDRIWGNCGSTVGTTPRSVMMESEFGAGTKVSVRPSGVTVMSAGFVAPSTTNPLSASTLSPSTSIPAGSVRVTISPRAGVGFEMIAPVRSVSGGEVTVPTDVTVKSSDSS